MPLRPRGERAQRDIGVEHLGVVEAGNTLGRPRVQERTGSHDDLAPQEATAAAHRRDTKHFVAPCQGPGDLFQTPSRRSQAHLDRTAQPAPDMVGHRRAPDQTCGGEALDPPGDRPFVLAENAAHLSRTGPRMDLEGRHDPLIIPLKDV